MSISRSIDTVVVGAGQAGLLASWHLAQAGREHVVLERRSTLGGGWQDRWDAFRLVGPNWMVGMPDHPYRGDDPDGFMPRDQIVDHFRGYGQAIAAPVELETDVTALDATDGPGTTRYRLTTSRGSIDARSVVVAGGPFQRPNVPAIGEGLSPSILSLHSHHYRSPEQLPPGRILLIGAGQTGAQLAEELIAAGREVIVSVGHCWHAPRRYRGRDIFWWLREIGTRGPALGVSLPTPDKLPSPAARFACNPQLSGHRGGHSVNLRRMAAEDGVRLAGRLAAIEGTTVRFASDLADNLRYADASFEERLRPLCEAFVRATGESFPDYEPEPFSYEPPAVDALDLADEGVSTILWTSGYRPSFDWIHLPVTDAFGLPVQPDGRTAAPGVTFLGTPWLVDMGSANLVALTRDAELLARTW